MKKLLTLLLTILVSTSSFAQQTTNLVFFSEQGEQFSVVLNGIQQNAEPQTNIKVTNLIQPYYKVKIIFKNEQLGQLDKTLNFNQGTETTFCIKRNNKGEYKLRWQSEVPIAQALPPAQNQNVIIYTTTPTTTSTTVTHTETTTVVNDGHGTDNGNVSMGVNINDSGMGVNMNMNVNVNDGNAQSSSYTSTTTTTTTSESYGSNVQTQEVYVMPGYSGATGCPWPMNEGEFSSVYNSIASKDWDDTKLTIAKQVISANCLTCSQVKQIMILFEWEDTRLDLAKWAYGHTFDIGNYYQLNDAFEWESSIEELNAYINGYRW